MTTTTTATISFPPDTLARAKAVAGPRNLSKFVTEAVEKKLSSNEKSNSRKTPR